MTKPNFGISPHAIVSPEAEIGAESIVSAGAWIGPGARIGKGCLIEGGAFIGYGYEGASNQTTKIGDGCLVATGSVVYHSVLLGNGVKIRHNVVIREHVRIGDHTGIGTGSNVEHHCEIGRGCSFHSQVHITDYSNISDYVFIGPAFASFSDKQLDYRRPNLHTQYQGIRIGARARVGGRVTMLPGAEIGEETVVGACSVVIGALPSRLLCLGNPARPISRIQPSDELSKYD